MIRLQTIVFVGLASGLAACAHLPASEPERLRLGPAEAKSFGPLVALIDQTWRSEAPEGADAGPDDIAHWSVDLGGRVLVNRHVLEDGSYGGVTYVYRNARTGSVDYVYATSAGFHTSGSFTFGKDGSFTSEEAVTGHDSITRVRSTGRIGDDGRLSMTSQYLQNGQWVEGRKVVYAPYAGPVPELKPAPE
jgi:hypothetical protein